MPLPYLLLDIDGVLIPFPAPDGATPATHNRHDVLPTGRQPDEPVTVWLNPDHGQLLTNVVRSGLLAPVWCTSWRQDAAALIGPILGLPPFPYVDLPRPQITTSHPNGYLWKRDYVEGWLADAPVVWIDDDFTALDHAWAAERNSGGIPTLLIQPHPRMGLLPEHLAIALRWASALSSSPSSGRGSHPKEEATRAVQLP